MALGAIIDAPDLDLVGVRVYDPRKIGVDAGELAVRHGTGVLATDSMAELLAADADVVLYMGAVEKHPDEALVDITTLLASGADVITTGSSMIDVYAVEPHRGEALAEACRQGSSSFLGLGLFPGFWGEAITPVLARLSARCDRIAVRESMSYAHYPSTEILFGVMGYGLAQDAPPPRDPSRMGAAFVGSARVVAKALGLQVRAVQPFRETAITDKDLHVAAGTIAANTIAAIRLGAIADCGPVKLTVEHVTWMDPGVAPQWTRTEGYEIEFGGAPTMRCNLQLGTAGESHTEMGCLATALHAVNAIPVVHASPAGVLDLADITDFAGRYFVAGPTGPA
jgi:hypothetical protein